jgi:hypothetical protein
LRVKREKSEVVKDIRVSYGIANINHLVDVGVAEGGWETIATHELVQRVNANHVMLNTKCKVFLDPRSLVHEISDGVHEVGDLRLAALSTSTEVLASKFSNPDREAECIMHLVKVSDERVGVGSVPVDGQNGN